MLPNFKTDTNNHGSFSTDNIGMNYDYPEATYERREEILQEHQTYQKGYFYFIANDPRVPEKQQKWMAEWGLAKDEFPDNGHWPHQIYVREARRMVSDFVITENHLTQKLDTPRSVGMGSYNMDSHNTQRYVDQRRPRAERGRCPDQPRAALSDRLRSARSQEGGMRKPPRPGLRLLHPHRLRIDPDGAGFHDPRPVDSDRRRLGHR